MKQSFYKRRRTKWSILFTSVPRLCDDPHSGNGLWSISLRMIRPTPQLRVRRFLGPELRSASQCATQCFSWALQHFLRSEVSWALLLRSRRYQKSSQLSSLPQQNDALNCHQKNSRHDCVHDFMSRWRSELKLWTSMVRIYCSMYRRFRNLATCSRSFLQEACNF